MRKVLMLGWGVVVALFGLFGVQVHLVTEIDWANIVAALLIIGVWVVTEAVKDWKALKEGVVQLTKWGDPSFWTAAIAALVLPFVTIPEQTVAIVASLLAIVAPIMANVFRKKAEIVE